MYLKCFLEPICFYHKTQILSIGQNELSNNSNYNT